MDTATKQRIISDEQLRIERSRYDTLVQSEILQLKLDTNYLKKIRNSIIFAVITVLIPCWLSSSKDSNLYWIINRLIGEKYVNSPLFYLYSAVFFITPLVMLMLTFSLDITVKNIKKNMSADLLLEYLTQKQIFYLFIHERLHIDSENGNYSDILDEILAFYNSNISQDITFTDDDLESFLRDYLKKYSMDFSINFSENYSRLITYNQCIEGVLIQTQYATNSTYELIISGNIDLFTTR